MLSSETNKKGPPVFRLLTLYWSSLIFYADQTGRTAGSMLSYFSLGDVIYMPAFLTHRLCY